MDIVSRIGMDASGLSSRESSDIFLMRPFFAEADEMMFPDPNATYVATGESMFDVYWRTLIGNKGMNSAEAPEEYAALYEQCRHFFDNTESISSIDQVLSLNLYYGCVASIILSYRFFVTQAGLVGLAPMSTQAGDTICVLNSGPMPFVVRASTEKQGMFRLVGGCYVHGLMKGEALLSPIWKEEEISLH